MNKQKSIKDIAIEQTNKLEQAKQKNYYKWTWKHFQTDLKTRLKKLRKENICPQSLKY